MQTLNDEIQIRSRSLECKVFRDEINKNPNLLKSIIWYLIFDSKMLCKLQKNWYKIIYINNYYITIMDIINKRINIVKKIISDYFYKNNIYISSCLAQSYILYRYILNQNEIIIVTKYIMGIFGLNIIIWFIILNLFFLIFFI